MRTLVTGGTGFVGRHLLARLDEAVVLSRRAETGRSLRGIAASYSWQPDSEPAPAVALDGVEVVFHLAGESIAEGRWTAAKKQRIRDSRVLGTKNLVAGIRAAPSRPKLLVCASAVGIYGSRGDEQLDESSPPGDDFLAEVCREWEAAAREAESLGVRVVMPRLALVIGGDGGAFPRLVKLFRFGVGGRLARGNQWMAWIHVDDVVGLMLHAAANSQVVGPMNAVAPGSVTNRQFTHELAAAVHRPAILPAPAFGLKLALGEFANVLLASQRVVPKVAIQSGYEFRYPELGPALRASLPGKTARAAG